MADAFDGKPSGNDAGTYFTVYGMDNRKSRICRRNGNVTAGNPCGVSAMHVFVLYQFGFDFVLFRRSLVVSKRA